MRVNIYAEEMTDRVEIIGKEIDGQTFNNTKVRSCTAPATTTAAP